MRLHVQKWGNSLALRIPKPFAQDVNVREGSVVDLSVREGQLVAAPVRKQKLTLKVLLAQVRKANLHGETDTGLSVGRESW